MTIRVVIQARMGSTRLPGKIMAPLAGRPLLWHVVRRLESALCRHHECSHHAPRDDVFTRSVKTTLLVATTAQPADDETAAWCRREGIPCFRGPDSDVLGRYLAAVDDLHDDDTLLRATADNPLYCPQRTAAIIAEHQQQAADYTCVRELSYVVPEVVRVGALRRMAERARDTYCREHVTPYFRQRPTEFRTLQLPAEWRGLRPEIRLTVDMPAELARMQRIFDACSSAEELFPLEAAYEASRRVSQCSLHAPREDVITRSVMTTLFSCMTVAVVGYGSIGRRHADNLARLGVGRCIVVRRREHANPAFTPPPDVRVVHDHRAAIDEGLDLAIVANPTSLHIETARHYLEAGVPVLIEKPLAPRLAGAELPCESAFCGMAYCTRYHPAYALARAAVQQGRIGQPCEATAWFESYLPAWHPWEDYRRSYAARPELGGGVLPTLDHDIDYFNWCFGNPEAAGGYCTRSGTLDAEIDDQATVSIGYPGGVSATLYMSLCRRDRRRGFELIGREGTLRFDMEQGQLLLDGSRRRRCQRRPADASSVGYDVRHPVATDGSGPAEVLWDGDSYDLNQMYVDLLADFLLAAHRDRRGPAPVPMEAGVETLRVMDALQIANCKLQIANWSSGAR